MKPHARFAPLPLLAAALLFAFSHPTPSRAESFSLETLKNSPAPVAFSASPAPNSPLQEIKVERTWDGEACHSTLINSGPEPRKSREVVLFSLPLPFPPETRIYAEGFSMLSQTGGSLEKPLDLGYLTDRDHYKLPTREGKQTVYNLFTLSPSPGRHLLFAFSSCRRFSGEFRFDKASLEIAVDLENLALAPGQRVELEDFVFMEGPNRAELLDRLARALDAHHPRLAYAPMPTGWCSWYCYGPGITEKQILANLDFAKKNDLPMKFIQIDDGYQAAMGDWLESGKGFGGGVQSVLKSIKTAGFEPAIWVAPFVAEKESRVFREHPDWFVKDDAGAPLSSDRVTFGGWRRGPWYALDGTHPEVQAHLEKLFRSMSDEWGCHYFKLDALFWGCMHGGHFHDPNATRVEAYRRGMEAILRGAGREGFILGCNHPMWPSLGLIHGSRSSMDVTRNWDNFQHIAAETFQRNWQNDRLWFNDPDCLLLYGKPTDDQFGFHIASVLASGGMVLSGDNMAKVPEARLKLLRTLLTRHPSAAVFADDDLAVGRMKLDGADLIALFNRGESPKSFEFDLAPGARLRDFWTNEAVSVERTPAGAATIRDVAPTSARVLKVE